MASSDDPYVEPTRAAEIAVSWGAELVALQGAGHINVEAGHGPWPEGRQLLERLSASC